MFGKNQGSSKRIASGKLFEIDFEPFDGWSYYRIREVTASGEENTTPFVPVFIGLELLQKAVSITPPSLFRDTRQKASLSQVDGKSFILVLQEQNGNEFLYDKPVRATTEGLYIQPGSGLPAGPYNI